MNGVPTTITDFFLQIAPRDTLDEKLRAFQDNPQAEKPDNKELAELNARKRRCVEIAYACAVRANPGELESDSPLLAKLHRKHTEALEPVKKWLDKPGEETKALCEHTAKSREGKATSTFGPDKVIFNALKAATATSPSASAAYARQSALALSRVLDDRNKVLSGTNLPLVLGLCHSRG